MITSFFFQDSASQWIVITAPPPPGPASQWNVMNFVRILLATGLCQQVLVGPYWSMHCYYGFLRTFTSHSIALIGFLRLKIWFINDRNELKKWLAARLPYLFYTREFLLCCCEPQILEIFSRPQKACANLRTFVTLSCILLTNNSNGTSSFQNRKQQGETGGGGGWCRKK